MGGRPRAGGPAGTRSTRPASAVWRSCYAGPPSPIVDAPAETVWIWSDLPLGDQALLATGERPFATVAEMDDHLLEAWRRRVEDEDLIICMGDVLHPEAQPATGERPPELPGPAISSSVPAAEIAVAGTTGPSSASSRQPWLSRIGTLAFFAPGLILLGWAQALRPPAPRAESAAAVLGIPEPLSYSVRGVRAVIGPWTVLACCAF